MCDDAQRCTAHPSYRALWEQFRSETAPGQSVLPPRRQIPAQLNAWHKWAQEKEAQGRLNNHQVIVRHGPQPFVRTYDSIVYGSAVIVGTVQEKSKHARDSVVMLRENNQYRAGRVTRFLSHTAPGCEGLDQQQDVNIADVQLYATVPPSNRAAAASETILHCPIFKRNLVDSPISGQL